MGSALGVGTVVAFFASRIAIALAGQRPLGQMSAFVASFVGFELTLYGAGLMLSADADAFSHATVEQVFAINLLTFASALTVVRLLAAASFSRLPAKPIQNTG